VRTGFTLIEILVATTLALLLMMSVMQILGIVTTSISEARSTLEMTDRLRTVASQLQRDLDGVTVTMMPPRRPELGEGYFEYIEGPVGPVITTTSATSGNPSGYQPLYVYAYNASLMTSPTAAPTAAAVDSTIGDNDDILMFTTRSKDRPFVGLCASMASGVVESQYAEVAWFVRGTTLYRRVLLIAPNAIPSGLTPSSFTSANPATSYYGKYDVSAHVVSTGVGNNVTIVGNTLGDLTKREYRFAHPYNPTNLQQTFPYDARIWGQLGLPTLRETASKNWTMGTMGALNTGFAPPAFAARDFWTNPFLPWQNGNTTVDITSGTMTAPTNLNDATPPRMSDDVVLNNVIGFDVKAWDPGAPVYSKTVGTNGSVLVLPGDPGYPTGALPAGTAVYSYGAFVDLGWNPTYSTAGYSVPAGAPKPLFNHLGLTPEPNGPVNGPTSGSTPPYPTLQNKSGLAATTSRASTGAAVYNNYLAARVYDTYSTHYEYDGISEAMSGTTIDGGTDGLDNDSTYGADDANEAETAPPYAAPLRGIQVKIRTFDPDSRQIREVTVVQDFLPK
jgi:hypothetical protein